MRLRYALIAMSLGTASSFAQDSLLNFKITEDDRSPTIARGETVSEMPKDLWHVFQSSDGKHWFGSHTQGAFRYDGKTITRFTKKDGLAGDEISGFQDDKFGNLYLSTSGGISKFDGNSFTSLKPTPASEWKKEPDDLWFGGSGVVHRYDGKTLHRLPFPKAKLGEDFMARFPREKFPNMRSTCYDVYSILKDSKGNVWFGTQNIGVVRYDGKSHDWISEKEITWLDNGPVFGVRSMIEDKEGMFWFTNTLHRYSIDRDAAAKGDGSPRYKKEKGIGDLSGHKQDEYDYFMSSVIGDDGAMWMAILGGVVYRYDGKSITPFHVKRDGKHHWILSLYKDRQGVLWLGTQENGAYRFNGKEFMPFKP
jgi:ligand-binding sensor domain-containing protein